MAVFTTFDRARLERYLNLFQLGELVDFSPIEAGIENSNYHVTLLEAGREHEYILTILEFLSFNEVSFFNTLLAHLSRQGLPVPVPRETLDGMTSTIFCGKPTLLFPKLPGAHPNIVDGPSSYKVGEALARIHDATASLGLPREKIRKNPYDPAWARSALASVSEKLGSEDYALMADSVQRYESLTDPDLPRGVIHGDLFRDNCLFLDDELTGIIDFYHACEDMLVLDLAITLNDWCSNESGDMVPDLVAEMIRGYESVRRLTDPERAALHDFQKVAAMCFVLSRLQSGDLKDPEEFLRIARALA